MNEERWEGNDWCRLFEQFDYIAHNMSPKIATYSLVCVTLSYFCYRVGMPPPIYSLFFLVTLSYMEFNDCRFQSICQHYLIEFSPSCNRRLDAVLRQFKDAFNTSGNRVLFN